MAASEEQTTQEDPFVLRSICQFLPAKDLAKVRAVSKLWDTAVILYIQSLIAGQRILNNPFAALVVNRNETKDFLWERLSAHLSNWNLRLNRESLDEDYILRQIHDGEISLILGSFSAWRAPFFQHSMSTPPENGFSNVEVSTTTKVAFFC